jgi:hypothetical protein
LKTFIGAAVCAMLGGGAVAGLQYRDAQVSASFKNEVKEAVFSLYDGRWTKERAAHATDYYAFPLTIYYNASDFDEAEYKADAAATLWSKFEYVDVAVRHVEIAQDSDALGDVRVTVDVTVSRRFKDHSKCEQTGGKQTADTTYILTLRHLDIGYRIKSEREMAVSLKCP